MIRMLAEQLKLLLLLLNAAQVPIHRYAFYLSTALDALRVWHALHNS